MEEDREIIIKIVSNKFSDDCAVGNLIHYILMEKHSKKKRRYTGGKGVYYLDWKRATEEFEIVQKWYKKRSKRRIYHMIISFPEEEEDIYSIYMFGQRVIEHFFENYQCVFAVHDDTENLHIHIGWNAVSYRDGKKWHMSRLEAKEMMGRIMEMWEEE